MLVVYGVVICICLCAGILRANELSFNSSLEDVESVAQRKGSVPTILISVHGCNTQLQTRLLQRILNDFESVDDESGAVIMSNPEVRLQITYVDDSKDVAQRVASDLSFCFLNRSSLLDQDLAVSRVFHCLSRPSLSPETSDLSNNSASSNNESAPKNLNFAAVGKPIFLIYQGASADHAQLNALASTALRCDAVLSDPHSARWLTADTQSAAQPRLLLLPIETINDIDEELIQTFRQVFWKHLQSLLPHRQTIMKSSAVEPVSTVMPKTKVSVKVRGMERVPLALERTQMALRSAILRETQKINGLSTGSSFAALLNEHLQRCEQLLTSQELPVDITDEEVRLLALQQWRRIAALNLKSLFMERLESTMQQALQRFNTEVHDIQLSITIIQELRALQQSQLNWFKMEAKESIPLLLRKHPDAISSWNEEITRAENRLSRVFSDYLISRAENLQSQRLLPIPGKRVPIELSLHLFLLHPLGKDHRQDPLLFESSKDNLIFNEQLAQLQLSPATNVLCNPVVARAALRQMQQKRVDTKSNIGKYGPVFSFLQKIFPTKLDQQSEFSREMLMFPLSLKSPSLPQNEGRGNKGRGGQSMGRTRQTASGLLQEQKEVVPPQSLIWLPFRTSSQQASSEELMQDVRRGIQRAEQLDQEKQGKRSLADELFNFLPGLKRDDYRHPHYNYGSRLSVSKAK